MKISEIKTVARVDEMARPAKICPDCGLSMSGNHYWYKGGWKCKKENIAKAQAAGAATVSTPTPPSASPTAQPSVQPSAPADTNQQPTPAKEKPVTAPTVASKKSTPSASAGPTFEDQVAKWAAVTDQASTRPRIRPHQFTVNSDKSVDVGADGVFCQGAAWKQMPFKVGKCAGHFHWAFTHITSCHNMPDTVSGIFAINNNKITDFTGCPTAVDLSVDISGNPASSLVGIPRIIKGSLHAHDMPNITSLKGIADIIDYVEDVDFTDCAITSNVMGLLLIDGLTHVTTGNAEVDTIINKHLAEGKDEFACQEELIDAGFAKYAKL